MHICIPLHFRSYVIHVVIGGDQPWFRYEDVCYVLAIAQPMMAAGDLGSFEGEYCSLATVPTPTGERLDLLVSLGAVHSIVEWSSEDAVARSFKRWLDTKVMPLLPTRFEPVTLLPDPEERLCSTTEIAESLGMSPSALGRKAKHLKTDQHGEWRPAAAPYSGRLVKQWWWNYVGRTAVERAVSQPGAGPN